MSKKKPTPTQRLRTSAVRAELEARRAKAQAESAAWQRIENSYKGGIPTRTSESWGTARGWRFGSSGDRQQVTDMRSRAFTAFRNNPVARTLVETETDNVIGDGLNYQPASSSTEWNREAKDRYYEWLDEASVRGPDIHTGCELQRLLWSRSRVGGDIGWAFISRGSDSFIQPIPSISIQTPDTMYGDEAVYDGIRFDGQGKPIAYYVLVEDERGRRDFVTVAARDFVYLPHFTEENQARGISCYNTIFDLLAHLDRYVDGVSLAAWMATVVGIIFKQNNASKQLNALPTLTNSQGDQQKAITFENGMVKYVGTDEDVAQVQPHQPMQQTPEFIRTMFRMLGQPFKMPLEIVAMDMSTVNFASARIGLLGFYRACRIKAAQFGSRWSRTIRWWLSRERLRDSSDRKKWRTAFPADFLKHDLLVNAWDYTDPVSEAQSDLLQMDMRTKSPQMILAERGRDGEQIIREWKEWQQKLGDIPQFHSTMTRDPAPEPAEEPVSPAGGRIAEVESETDQENSNGNGNGQ